MNVARMIVLTLVISLFFNCKSFKVVTYQKPMSNLELARYIRLIEHRRVISLENYFYNYGIRPRYGYNYYQPYNYNRIYKNTKRYNVITPQTGTTGNTTYIPNTTPNVQPPISNGNIKTKQ